MSVETQKKIDICYNNEKVGIYIPDIIINGKVIIELKSKPFITHEDEKQFWGYIKNSDYRLGFLINFAPRKLEIKRFAHSRSLAEIGVVRNQHKSA